MKSFATNNALPAESEVDSLTRVISHDLRAPLRHIEGYLEMIGDDDETRLSEESRTFLGSAQRSARRLSGMIEELVGYTRLLQTELDIDDVDLGLVLAEVVGTAGRGAHQHAIEWHVGSLPRVRGDARLLRELFMLLVDNAVKFTGDRATGRIEVTCCGYDGLRPARATVKVTDNGIGFDMRYAHQLGEVFRCLHSRSDAQGMGMGMGMGLAKARRIAARHNGKLWAEAVPDQGATFFVSLPMIPTDAAVADE